MNRTAKRALALAGIPFLVAVAVLFSCNGEDEAARFARHALEAEGKLSEVQAELARCQGEAARAKERLAAAEQRADELSRHLADERLERRGAQEKTHANEAEFYASLAIAFSAVVAAMLVLHLLLKERRARKVMGRFLRWLKLKGRKAT